DVSLGLCCNTHISVRPDFGTDGNPCTTLIFLRYSFQRLLRGYATLPSHNYLVSILEVFCHHRQQ
ncbi:MAG: hypothetical protein AB4426_02110, partial [Xenococcaceae cyanobacterium]